jgi:hypothetical protein
MTPVAKLVDVGSLGSYFESLSDPRHTRNRKHLLVDIAVIAVCGILCGCDGPTAIHRWARHRASWLAQHLALPNGIPSRDCIRRLLMALKPEAFQRCFLAWISEAAPIDADDPGRLVAIDGKTCRRSHDGAKGLGALHIVSAWASEQGIAPGQVAPTPSPTRSPPSRSSWGRSTWTAPSSRSTRWAARRTSSSKSSPAAATASSP